MQITGGRSLRCVRLIRCLLVFLIAAAYLGATLVVAASPVAGCPALDNPVHAAQHHHGEQHHHPHDPSGKAAGECLKCCLGACLAGACLLGPTVGVSSLVFVGSPVLYWAVSPPISGRAIVPDPGR